MTDPLPQARLDLPEPVRCLMAAGRAAPSADNTQPWRLCWHPGDATLSVRYHPDAAAPLVFGNDRHCEHLTMGAIIENLVQAATAADLAVDWTLDPAGPEYLRGVVPAAVDDATAAARIAAHPLFKRHTNRLAFATTPLGDAPRHALDALAEPPCRLLVMTARPQIAEIGQLVQAASRLRFRTREIHEWFARVLRFSPDEVASGTGLDVATIDLPPGGRALLRLIQDWRRLSLLNRVGMYKLLAGIEAAKVENCAAVLAVIGPTGAVAEVAAGRLLERAWISLNDAGLAVQPFYVVTDLLRRLETGRTAPELLAEAQALQRRLASLLPAGDSLHMLLRVGQPTRDPVRALRLPLDVLCGED